MFVEVIRPSADSGGSDGTTIKVFLQEGHRKQFRAHLCKNKYHVLAAADGSPVFLSSNACTRDLEQTIRTIIAANFNGDASIASYQIAFIAEVEVVNFMIGVRR